MGDNLMPKLLKLLLNLSLGATALSASTEKTFPKILLTSNDHHFCDHGLRAQKKCNVAVIGI